MQISVSTNQITAPAAPANMGGGAGLVVVDGAENIDSVSFAPVDAVSISDAARKASEQPSTANPSQTDDPPKIPPQKQQSAPGKVIVQGDRMMMYRM